MKGALILALVLVQLGASKPVTLELPKTNNIPEINVKMSLETGPYKSTYTYEATEGNTIAKVVYHGKTIFEAEPGDRPVKRTVYLEKRAVNKALAIESKYEDGMKMAYFRLDATDAMQITYMQFLGLLTEERNRLPQN